MQKRKIKFIFFQERIKYFDYVYVRLQVVPVSLCPSSGTRKKATDQRKAVGSRNPSLCKL